MNTGELIRLFRKKKMLTQKQLGELCGIAEPNIRKYELGKSNPRPATLQRIAEALNIGIEILSGYVPDPYYTNGQLMLALDNEQINRASETQEIVMATLNLLLANSGYYIKYSPNESSYAIYKYNTDTNEFYAHLSKENYEKILNRIKDTLTLSIESNMFKTLGK